MVQRTHVFAEHQTLQLDINLLSITRNISMLWGIVELAYGVTWRQSRRNHQKYKPQIEQRSGEGHDVIECDDCRETTTWCSRCVEESSPRLAVKQRQFDKFLQFFFLPILHLLAVVHKSVNLNSNETRFYHCLPVSQRIWTPRGFGSPVQIR